jgi:hypothetical protein
MPNVFLHIATPDMFYLFYFNINSFWISLDISIIHLHVTSDDAFYT